MKFPNVMPIYVSCGIYYFLNSPPALLFLLALAMGIVFWLIGLYAFHALCPKIDAEPLRTLWHKVREHDEIAGEINRQFKKMEEILRTLKHPNQNPLNVYQDDNVAS